MTIREAAHQLDLSVWRTWQLCTSGVIPSWEKQGKMYVHPEAVASYSKNFAPLPDGRHAMATAV